MFIQANPNNVTAILGWADVLSKISREREAAEYFLSVAVKYHEAKDTANALRLTRRACEVCPAYCEARLWYGAMLVESGSSLEAVEHLEASSWKENCSSTHLAALDRLVGIYTDLQAREIVKLDPHWLFVLARAQEAAAEVQKQTNKKP